MASIKKLLNKQNGLFGPGGKNKEKESYRMMVSNLERVKHSFPSRASPHPNCVGQACRYTVHRQGYNTSGAAQGAS